MVAQKNDFVNKLKEQRKKTTEAQRHREITEIRILHSSYSFNFLPLRVLLRVSVSPCLSFIIS